MTPLEKCLTIAKESGVPKDQANSFISKGYIPLPWQWKFHAAARAADNEGGPVDIGAGGARGPGKSHAVMSQVGLDDCQRVDNLKVLFLRQTSLSATESFSDLIEKTLSGKVPYKYARNSLKFANGSRIILGGFKDEKDIDKYVGIEYDIIVVEELNQLTKTKYEKLRGSLRTSKPNWRPRTYTSFNPGGVGHDLVKNRYVVPHLDGKETDTAFIPSTYKDNKHLNKEYIDYLEGLDGELGRAWREGEFFIFAGQMFTELREQIHICQPRELPVGTKYFAGYDYGYNHPFAFVLLALTPDGDYYVVSHIRKRFYKPDEQAKKMLEMLKGKDSTIIYAGHDIYANRDGGRTIEDQLLEAGFINSHHTIVKAGIDHVQGVAELRKMFSLRPDKTPYLRFFSNTLEVYECLATRQIDPNHPEDVMKEDAVEGEGGDDLYDACFPWFTRVKTQIGNKFISNITTKDSVYTSNGIKRVLHSWKTGYKNVSLLITKNGRIIIATPNHPIKSKNEFVRLDALRYGDTIETWQQSYTKTSGLETIQTLRENIYKTITTQVEIIKRGGLSLYIERFIKTILEKYQVVTTSIIKMEIHSIIHQKILSVYQEKNMLKDMRDQLMNFVSILRTYAHSLLNGINQKMVENGTVNTQKKYIKTEKLLNIPANSALENISQNMLVILSFVLMHVKQSIAEIVVLIIYLALVLTVKPFLLLINTLKQKHAPDTVLLNIPIPIKTKVYNLEVEHPEYYAGGILVHNCRYAVRSWTMPNKKYVDVKPNQGQVLLNKLKAQKQGVTGWR